MNKEQEARAIAQEGFQLLQQNELRSGAEKIEKALALSPQDPYVLNALGVAHLRAGNNFKAICFLHRAGEILQSLKASPTSIAAVNRNMEIAAKFLEEEGLAHLRASRPARAEHFFRQTLEFTTEKSSLRRNLISALEMRGKLAHAFLGAQNLAVDLIRSQDPTRQNLERLKKILGILISPADG